MKKVLTDLAKDILSKRAIDDLQQFFKDNYVDVNKIVVHGQNTINGSIKFYEIHFDNTSTVDMDLISKSLDRFGYTPKSFHGCLPDSFYLLVLMRKKL